jgi:hypothetical protein
MINTSQCILCDSTLMAQLARNMSETFYRGGGGIVCQEKRILTGFYLREGVQKFRVLCSSSRFVLVFLTFWF